MADDQATEGIKAARYEALTNARYHGDREAFLARWHRWLMFIIIVLGTASVTETMPDGWRVYPAALTGIFAAIDLVFSLTGRARDHGFLRRRYFEIAALLENQPNLASARASLTQLAGEEEPPYFAVYAIAENWASMSVYGNTRPAPCKISRWQKFWRNYSRFDGTDFACSD